MVRFPETAAAEWEVAAASVEAEIQLRQRIHRDTEVEKATEKLRVRHEASLAFQRELDADSTPILEMGTLSDYLADPSSAPSDLIEGVMKENGLCIIMGPSESGKTSIALQALHAMLTGGTFLGQQAVKIKAAGVASYDMDVSMVYNWLSGSPGIDPNSVIGVNAYKRGHPLGVPALRERIAEAWRKAGVEVVLIDSFSASFFGRSQNDAAEVMAYYRDMKLFALTEVGAKALIVIAHSTDAAPERPRGSTVHKDTADTTITVTVGPDKKRKVEVGKYREALGQTKMPPVIVTAPDSVTHLVSIDPGAMSLAGLDPHPSVAGAMFDSIPETHNDPEIGDDDSEDEEGDL